jgi:glycosidase
MRSYPHLYEINTQLFLTRLSAKENNAPALAELSDSIWKQYASLGFDLVWLMGVWQRSPASRQEALQSKGLRERYDSVLPGWTENDVTGSPYAIYDYSLDPSFGVPDDLQRIRTQLNRNNIGLILDFVPNHLARDHAWTQSHPAYFVRGSKADVGEYPDRFFSPRPGVYMAHGRDPNYSPWTDTVQLNVFAVSLRRAMVNTLLHIAEVADGVRCDMAMLVLNDVFEKTWGNTVKGCRRPPTEFWSEAIAKVKEKHPGFLFIAEVYWGLEPQLQHAGFDFMYDKTLYDRIRFSTARDILDYLRTHSPLEHNSAYFIENHDEQRAITAFGRKRSMAAAVIMATLPCLRLFNEGQMEGKKVHVPVQLVREPDETIDPGMQNFYYRLLTICNQEIFHKGIWRLVDTGQAWEGERSYANLLAWSWHYNGQVGVVVTNYSPNPARGWIRPRLAIEGNNSIVFRDELTDVTYTKESPELRTKGIYVDLAPYQSHILSTIVR